MMDDLGVEGQCLECGYGLGIITVHMEIIRCPSCGATEFDFKEVE